MKKILVITPFFYPHIGGSERYIEDLYVFFKKKYPSISVDLLCYNTDKVKEREKYRGLNIYRIPCWRILPGQFCLPKPLSLFEFFVNHRSYDLVHSSTRFFDNSWWAPIYAKLIKAKVVLTDHCSSHPISSNGFIDALIRFIEMTIVRFSLHLYDKIYAENKKTQEFLKRKFKVSSQIAYPGLSCQHENFKSKNKHKVVRIAYVGRMIESKGVEILLEIAREIPEANFIFAGDGPLMNSLKDKVKSNKLTNISILGNLSRREVSKLLKSADIFAYPSMHSEGLPLALIEAGVNGLAVLTTNSGGIQELIKDNKTGILVEPNDKKAFKITLDRLIRDESLRQKLAKNLYDYTIKNFSWENSANLIIKELQ